MKSYIFEVEIVCPACDGRKEHATLYIRNSKSGEYVPIKSKHTECELCQGTGKQKGSISLQEIAKELGLKNG